MPLADDLLKWFSSAEKIVIVGVGNPIRKDDNIGVEIVCGIEGKVSDCVMLIKGETVPEDFVGTIIEFKPTHILITDAASMGLRSGSVKLTGSVSSSGLAISTHSFPIQIFCEYLVKATGAKVALLLIQPKDTDFGEGLTPELKHARERLVKLLIKAIRSVGNTQ